MDRTSRLLLLVAIAEAACRSCHAEITDAIEHGTSHRVTPAGRPASETGQEEFSCIRCHRYVGHWVR